VGGSSPFVTASFKQPAATPQSEKAAPSEPAANPKAPPKAEKADAPDGAPADPKPKDAAPAAEEPQFETLDAVKDDIRKRLARERAETRIDAMYTAVAGDISRYAEDYALWQARRPSGVEAPRPPDLAKIAEKQGLQSGRSELIPADSAAAAGGIGGSFEFIADPTSRFGIRQQRWLEQMFGAGAMSLRPVRSRDVEGNRYLSWRTEDQPEFTPSFTVAKPGAEYAWRIVEGRALARRRADEIARQSETKQQSLEATVAAVADAPATDSTGPKAMQVGPFSWLRQGAMASGGPPLLSDPEGVAMAGDAFMRAVFALEPGQTAVAFNEPQTVCYCIRLVSLEPSSEELRESFLASRNDRQRLAMVAQRQASETFRALILGMEQRYHLDWKRQPRMGGR